MLKLYYTPGACSIVPHVTLREAGIPFELERVDLMRKKLPDGGDFTAVNPKGYVPALRLEDGMVLTEVGAVVQYIADLKPESGLAAAPGTVERARLQEWLNFIATELHKGIGALFLPKLTDELKEVIKDRAAARLAFLATNLEGKRWLLGERFTVADAYAFYAMRSFTRFGKRDLPEALAPYYERIAARPAVLETLAAEGLQ